MLKKITRRRLVVLLALGALMAFGVYAYAAPLAVPPQTGALCTTGPTFNLEANSGYASFPDGNSILMWSYALDTTSGLDAFQLPGPVLCVTEGATVTINLRNNLPDPPGALLPDNASIVFPGQTGVTATGGVAGLFTREATPGGTVTYTFVADEPGTYLYESGTNVHKQLQMGLYGALIVRPAGGANFAYNDPITGLPDPATQFDPNQEYVLVLHAIDPAQHQAVERGETFDATIYHAHYWTVNGRSFPDSIADNNAPWLPAQPYGALVQVEISPTLPALIRYANASQDNHPFHPHGNHLRVIARDGRLLRGPANEDASMEAFTKTIGSGQTYDLLLRILDAEAWTSTGPLPGGAQPYPLLLNLVFKDGLTFYSGSPFLGQQDDFQPGNTVMNECGEFYYPWHSHALNEFQNFDEGFGGLATLLRVDPTGGCP